jgi:hypothetical protein
METDGVKRFLKDNCGLFFQIKNSAKETVTAVQSETVEDSQLAFDDYFHAIPDGRYSVVCGEHPKAVAGKAQFPFIKSVKAPKSNEKTMSHLEIQEAIQNGINQGLAKEKAEFYQKQTLELATENRSRLEKVEAIVKELVNAYNLSVDSDPTNDVKEIMKPVFTAAMGKVAKGVSTFKFA